MQKSKEQIKSEIKSKYEELCRMYPQERWYFSYPDGLISPSYPQKLVDEILELILELVRITPEEEGNMERGHYTSALDRLHHSRYKEIEFLDYSYKKATKKGASQKSKDDYRRDLNAVASRVDLDIFMVLQSRY